MTAPTVAWGAARLFQLPNGEHLWGREFELLPAGTMMAAGAILHGLAGLEATVDRDNLARVPAGSAPVVYAIRDTTTEELEAYGTDVLESYRQRQLQDAQG
jgi:hypothetical protein